MNIIDELRKAHQIWKFEVVGNHRFPTSDEEMLRILSRSFAGGQRRAVTQPGPRMAMGLARREGYGMTCEDLPTERVEVHWHRYIKVERRWEDQIEGDTHDSSLEKLVVTRESSDSGWEVTVTKESAPNEEIQRLLRVFHRSEKQHSPGRQTLEQVWDDIRHKTKVGDWTYGRDGFA